MKVVNNSSTNYSDRQRDMYDFDRLSTLADVKEVIATLLKSGFTIENIVVREFDDYENAPTVLGYDLSEIDNISKEFAGKAIDSYTLSGNHDDRSFFAKIVPDANRLIIDYSPRTKSEVLAMIKDLEEQEQMNMSNTIDLRK